MTLLTNYCPMSSLKDVVGGADLYRGTSYSFTIARYKKPNSAVSFRKGFLKTPSDVYFDGNLTITP